MKKLKLPISQKPLPRGKTLKMEEYVEFVDDNLKLIDFKEIKPRRKKCAQYMPFKLKKS